MQVAADGLELAHDRPPLVERQPLRRRGAQLDEALERRHRSSSPSATGCGSRTRRAYSRASTRRPRAAKRGNDLDGRLGGGRELLVGHGGDRVDREPAKPREVELDVVLGEIELLQIRAHRRRPGSPRREARRSRSARAASRASSRPRPSTSPWWIDLRQLAAERARDALLNGKVRAVVVAADDVRDPELEIVRRRTRAGTSRSRPRGASVVPPRASRTEPSSSRSAPAGLERALGGRGVRRRRARSAAPALRRARRRARRGRRGSPPPRPRPLATDPCRRSAARSAPPCSSAKRRLATAVSALPRCSEPVGLGAKRTRTDTAYASIGTCPGCAGDPLEPRADRRVRLEVEPALVRDVRVRVERDVRDRVAVADEERRARRGAAPSRRAPRSRPSSARAGDR